MSFSQPVRLSAFLGKPSMRNLPPDTLVIALARSFTVGRHITRSIICIVVFVLAMTSQMNHVTDSGNRKSNQYLWLQRVQWCPRLCETQWVLHLHCLMPFLLSTSLLQEWKNEDYSLEKCWLHCRSTKRKSKLYCLLWSKLRVWKHIETYISLPAERWM